MKDPQNFTRRDFIKITAVLGGALAAGKLTLDLFDEKRFAFLKETRLLMGTVINLAVLTDNKADGEYAIDATFDELERLIQILDFRQPTSPIADLNRTGSLIEPPRELADVLRHAHAISEITAGAFDVTIKPLVDLYQRSQPSLPNEKQISDVLTLVDYRNMFISGERIDFLQPGLSITLDGIAKGYIVDAGVGKLHQLGYENIFVEAGGDLMAAGKKDFDSPWKIGVKAPRDKEQGVIGSFEIEDRAVATSGDYLNYFSLDMTNHHIINPKSGYSSSFIASATVIAPNCVQADGLATALMVLPLEEGLDLVDKISCVECLLVTKNLEEFRSYNFPA